jgi:hypothetical protein
MASKAERYRNLFKQAENAICEMRIQESLKGGGIRLVVTSAGNLDFAGMCFSPKNALKIRDWLTDTFEDKEQEGGE